jgi:hypothetical protein
VAASDGPVPGSRRALLLLASAMLLAMTTWFSATAVLPQLRTAWTLTTVQASFLTIAVQVGFVVGALVCAFFNLADIIPARTLMLLGALGAAAVNVLLAGRTRPARPSACGFSPGRSWLACIRRGSRRCPHGSGPAAAPPWASWWGR